MANPVGRGVDRGSQKIIIGERKNIKLGVITDMTTDAIWEKWFTLLWFFMEADVFLEEEKNGFRDVMEGKEYKVSRGLLFFYPRCFSQPARR